MPEPIIHCAGCGGVLGAEIAGLIYVQHKGRKVLGRILSIECDACGLVWLSDAVQQPAAKAA